MAEVPQPLFEVGQRVFDKEGRTGIVSSSFFLPERETFRYVVDGIPDILDEDELSDIPFGVSEPLTWRERAAVRLVAILQRVPGLDVRHWTGLELKVPEDDLDEAPPQAGGGTLEAALTFWARRGFFPPDEEPPPVDEPPPDERPGPIVDLEDVMREVDRRIGVAVAGVIVNALATTAQLQASIAAQVGDLAELTNRRFANRESVVTDALDEIRNSLSELEADAQEGAGLGLRALLGLIGGFIRNPLGWFIERAEGAIQAEILAGLGEDESDAVIS